MFNQDEPAAAIERCAGDDYRQHNPHVGDRRQAFIDDFDRMSVEYPSPRVEFKRVLADGRFVVLHCDQTWPDEEFAGIDIFSSRREREDRRALGRAADDPSFLVERQRHVRDLGNDREEPRDPLLGDIALFERVAADGPLITFIGGLRG